MKIKKKFIVRDEDKKEYEVEEVETKVEQPTEDEAEPTEPAGEASLSESDISALKKLAGIADKLVALVDIEKEEHEGEEEAEMLDEDEDENTLEDEDEDEDDEEEIIDTDEELDKMKGQDSKKSVGTIAQKTKNKDSIADAHEMDIADAWSKRYGGNK